MTLVVTHPYVSTITESTLSGGAGGLVGPTEWNANHTLAGVASPAQGGTGITSGTGVTYFSSATVLADSGTLTANSVLVGGGANVAPKFDGNFTYGAAGGGVSIILTSSTSTNAGLSIVTSSSSNMASNASALNIAATFNNSGTTYDAPLFMNIIDTASAAASLFVDIQKASSSVFTIDKFGGVISVNYAGFSGAGAFVSNNALPLTIGAASGGAAGKFLFQTGTFQSLANSLIGFNSSTSNAAGATDTSLFRDAATSILALGNANSSTTAAGFRVYNTTDNVGTNTAPTNYERGVFDWVTNANVLTIGSQKGGTGTLREVLFVGFGGAAGILRLSGANEATLIPTVWCYAWGTPSSGAAGQTGIGYTGVGILEFNNGIQVANGGTLGWYNWAGESRVSANSTTTSTALANVPGLAFVPKANRNYSFEAQLIFTDTAAGGIQCTVNATSTTTTYTLTFDGWVTDTTAVRGYAQGSAFGNVVASSLTTGNLGHVTITGTLMTSATAPSTVTIQFAQNTSNATPTTILIGSHMWTQDMP